MRAEENQIPVEKPKESLSNNLSKPIKADNLWAEIRRLKARVESLETQGSTLRRDINRLDRQNYRGASKLQPSDIVQKPDDGQRLDPVLFGGA